MIPAIDKTWTLFLDRDGVINERIMGGYVLSRESFHFLNQVPEAIAKFNQWFGRVVVVTNQQCIEKGLISERNLSEIHAYMSDGLASFNAKIDRVYFAPELASNPNHTRKPRPDMAFQAKQNFPEIDFTKSIMVGDTDSDIAFGQNLGMITVRIETEEKITIPADLTVRSLFELAYKIENEKI